MSGIAIMFYQPAQNKKQYDDLADIEAQNNVPNTQEVLEAWQESLDSDEDESSPLEESNGFTISEHDDFVKSVPRKNNPTDLLYSGKLLDSDEPPSVHGNSSKVPSKHPSPSFPETTSLRNLQNGSKQKPALPNFNDPHFYNEDVTRSGHPNRSIYTQLPRNEFSNARVLWNRLSARDRVLWRWANVENLDSFLQQVYTYYTGKGLSCIIVHRLFQILTVSFVIGFTTFITSCIDWPAVTPHGSLAGVTKSQCIAQMSPITYLVLWLFLSFLLALWIYYLTDIPRLWQMREFYIHALKIATADMPTVSWQRVLYRLLKLKNVNALTAEDGRVVSLHNMKRLDAYAIANRIMRKDNYFIALINNGIINIELPLLHRRILTHTTEWNINWCIFNFVFDEQGQLRSAFRNPNSRKRLSEELRRRFIVAGFLNCLFAPIVAIYLVIHNFFRYFNEYHKNPGALSTRRYTPLALWTFREYNELQHFFDERINDSYAAASHYVSQFPDFNMIRLFKYISFILGSFTAILVIITVFDPELMVTFEITKDRSVLFYLGLFGSLIAVSRSIIPDETLVFAPEKALRRVITFTHYMPGWWSDNMHSKAVQQEFCSLYSYRIVNLLWEILGILLTPVLLFFTFPSCSQDIVDFFREHTINVEGVGYVCSYAVFQDNPPYESVASLVQSRKISPLIQNKPELSRISFYEQFNTEAPRRDLR